MKVGGRMVVPVGSPYSFQTLMLVKKRKDGSCGQDEVMTVMFTPLPDPDQTSDPGSGH